MSESYANRKHQIFHFLKAVVKPLFPKHVIIGVENIVKSPAVFLCNHAGSYAPIVMELCFPIKFRPWVIYNIVTPKLCRDYLETDFVKKELKIREPFSKWIAAVIEPFCIRIMDSVEAIPVYKGLRKIRQTFDLSIEALLQGDNLLIFPEDSEKKYTESINEFNIGFLHLSKLYYEATGKPLYFHPTFVNKKKKTITIAKPIEIANTNSIRHSRICLKNYLQIAMDDIAK